MTAPPPITTRRETPGRIGFGNSRRITIWGPPSSTVTPVLEALIVTNTIITQAHAKPPIGIGKHAVRFAPRAATSAPLVVHNTIFRPPASRAPQRRVFRPKLARPALVKPAVITRPLIIRPPASRAPYRRVFRPKTARPIPPTGQVTWTAAVGLTANAQGLIGGQATFSAAITLFGNNGATAPGIAYPTKAGVLSYVAQAGVRPYAAAASVNNYTATSMIAASTTHGTVKNYGAAGAITGYTAATTFLNYTATARLST